MKKKATTYPGCGAITNMEVSACSENYINHLQSLKLRPIIMSGDMVIATRNGSKKRTRRLKGLDIVNEDPGAVEFIRMQEYPDGSLRAIFQHQDQDEPGSVKSPYGKPGDILWIRESGWVDNNFIRGLSAPHLYWRADYKDYGIVDKYLIKEHCCSFPSIHMYKEFARTFIFETNIRIERLHDITEEDAIAEGVIDCKWEGTNIHRYKDYISDPSGYGDPAVDFPTVSTAKESYQTLWDKLNKKRAPWDSNPWVWVVSFEVCDVKFTQRIKEQIWQQP